MFFSQKFLFLKCFLKFLTKISVKKPSNTLFSIKMQNNIFNSIYTEIFVSPCIYKLIIFIYIFSFSEAELPKNDWSGVGLEPSPCVYACMRCITLTDRPTNDTKQHSTLHSCSYMSTHIHSDTELTIKHFSLVSVVF